MRHSPRFLRKRRKSQAGVVGFKGFDDLKQGLAVFFDPAVSDPVDTAHLFDCPGLSLRNCFERRVSENAVRGLLEPAGLFKPPGTQCLKKKARLFGRVPFFFVPAPA